MNTSLQKLALIVVLTSLCSVSWGQGQYYRFVNDEGVKVMSSSVPPSLAKNGYEVVSAQGKVIRVVPPAPAPEDVERVRKERAVMEKYKVLARRYSTVDELIAARERKLSRLSANIAILKNNISGLNSQIDDLMSKGADAERSGRAVPQQILTNIDQIKAEIATTESRLQNRLAEEDQVHQDFADDLILFEKGLALENDGSAQQYGGTNSVTAP